MMHQVEREFQHKSNKTGKSLFSAEEKKRLGLDRPITRRDFIKGLMVGAGCLVRSARVRSRACFIRSIMFDTYSRSRPQVLITTSAFRNALYQSTSSGVQK